MGLDDGVSLYTILLYIKDSIEIHSHFLKFKTKKMKKIIIISFAVVTLLTTTVNAQEVSNDSLAHMVQMLNQKVLKLDKQVINLKNTSATKAEVKDSKDQLTSLIYSKTTEAFTGAVALNDSTKVHFKQSLDTTKAKLQMSINDVKEKSVSSTLFWLVMLVFLLLLIFMIYAKKKAREELKPKAEDHANNEHKQE